MSPLLLWLLGYVVGLVPAIVLLRRRGHLSLGTVSALLWAGLGLLVGARWHSRLEFLPVADALLMPPSQLVGGGMRLPLGFVVGALTAGFVCFVSRTSWRDVGDALAVGASVLIPIGRIGCLLNGCCMGIECGPWALAAGFCLRHPPGTEIYDWQVASHRIGSDAAATLPSHPLPIYFALASLATLLVLAVLWKRGAPAGAMLATFCILRPAAKLALEPLRAAAPDGPQGLMVAIPVSVLALTLLALVLRALHRRRLVRSRAVIATSGALVLLGLAGSARADLFELLGHYAEHPLRYRREMMAVGSEHDPAALPELLLLAVGDAHLRGGDVRGARPFFDALVQRRAGEPWESWARFGLGWCAVVADDPDTARTQFDQVGQSRQPGSDVARLMVALLDARAGRTAAALEQLEQLDADRGATPGLNQVARLAGGWVRYWAGDFTGAREALASLERDFPDEPLADDAAYGAALALWHMGSRAEAAHELDALADSPRREGTPSATAADAALDPRTLLRMAFRRYRRLPLEVPGARMTVLLDQDGAGLARIARRRSTAMAPARAARYVEAWQRETTHTSMPRIPPTHAGIPAGARLGDASVRAVRWLAWTIGLLAACLLLRRGLRWHA